MQSVSPENENYVAVIVELRNLKELPGLDNLVAYSHWGYQALVPKESREGDVGIMVRH